MKRIYCDGCDYRGIARELIEPDFAKVRLNDETATVLDLCFDCMPFYEQFKKEMEALTVQSAMNFRKTAKLREKEFWKKVKSGGTEKEKHSQKVGQPTNRPGKPKVEGLSQRQASPK